MHIRSHNNALGQYRNSIFLPNKASSYKLSNGSKNIEVKKKIDYISLSFQSLKVLVLLVLKSPRPYSP